MKLSETPPRVVGPATAVARLVVGAVIAVSSASACGPSVTPDMIVPDPVRTSSPSSGTGAPVFDVHEWGLIDVSSRGARLLAGPPSGPTNWNAPRKKPVVYFHLAPGTQAFSANVTVDVPPPGIAEQFPRGTLSPSNTSLSWSGLRVRPEGCHVTGAPTKESAACGTADGQCEAAAVANYEAADAACIDFGGGSFNHLFYRADGPPPSLPFEVTIDHDQLVIAHTQASDVVGTLLYVHNDGGVVSVASIAPPALGQSVRAAPPTGGDAAGARRAIDATMRQTGLTPDEVTAFDRAWTNDLFGEAAGKDVAKKAAMAAEDYLLFAMPASLVDGASRLTIRPLPRSVRRFLLVRLRV
jgi:hypothetical protein